MTEVRPINLAYEDLRAVLGSEEPPPEDFVIDSYLERGTHLLLCGRGGKGKTMFVNQLCTPTSQLKIGVYARKIIWIDAEMGRLGTQRRYWRTGLEKFIPPGRINYVSGAGLDLTDQQHHDELKRVLEGHEIAVIDSLRKVCRYAAENSSDEMAAVVQDISDMAHNTGCAILTIHHQGGDPYKWFRGSTAILDSADALIGWLPHQFNTDEDDGMRRLAARGTWAKVRNHQPPEDRWFKQEETTGLFVPCEAPTHDSVSKWDDVLREHLPFTGTKTALAEACGTDLRNKAWDAAYKRLVTKDGDTHTPVAEEPAI